MNIHDLYTSENAVFRLYGYYAALLGLKLLGVAFTTSYYRMTKKVVANDEDRMTPGSKVAIDPTIERTRRAHLNDLENIPLFWALGLLYVGTNPSYYAAAMCYRIFTAARFLHTFVYLAQVRQPARALSFMVGCGVNIFMAFSILKSFC